MKTTTFGFAYRNMFNELLENPLVEVNARTGVQIKMLEGAHAFKLDLRNGKLPVAGNRRYYPRVSAAEVAWQFMGTKDPEFILSKAPKLWSKFVEDGELKTAYGYRWRHHFGRDQLALAIKELRDNPTNRQLWVQAWDPAADGLGGPQPKNIPCPIGFSISRINDDIHMSVFIRSSDMFVGLPYDVMAYALTLDAIAASVGCRPATLHFTMHHPHLYEPHWNAARACTYANWDHDEWREKKEFAEATTSWLKECEPNLPGWTVGQIEKDPDGYCLLVGNLAKRVEQHKWDPVPAVIE